MIDWVTAKIPCQKFNRDRLQNGCVAAFNSHGETEWVKEKSQQVIAENGSSLQVSLYSDVDGVGLRIDGNPAKWLQGHNVFGSNNLRGLIWDTLLRLFPFFEMEPTDEELDAWERGDYPLTRVDCTEMIDLGSKENVNAWLNTAQFQAKSRHGKPIMTGGTLYFGKHSRRWAMKFYSKGEEMLRQGGRKDTRVMDFDQLLKYAEPMLRIELVLRKPRLEGLGLDRGCNWPDVDMESLIRDHLAKVTLSDQFRLVGETMEGLKPRLVAVVKLWEAGEDVRSIYSASTFYRYRRDLLGYGIDISIAAAPSAPRETTLREVVDRDFADVPAWAIATGLFHQA